MNNNIVEFLKSNGIDEQEIKKLPLPFLFADLMPSQQNAVIQKRLLYDSPYHLTSKMPQSFFYKRISTIINLENQHE